MGNFIKPRCITAPKDMEYAKRLHQKITSTGAVIRGRSNLHRWAGEFAALRAYINDDQRIANVFEFYLEHFQQQFIPKALSGRAFRIKFAAIDAAYRRQRDDSVRSVVITEDARTIQRLAGYIIWPGDEGAVELTFIQASLNNYRSFQRQMMELCDRLHGTPDYHAVRYFLAMTDPDPMEYIKEWLELFERIARTWVRWNGRLLSHVWHIDHRRFVSYMHDISVQWCGDAYEWDRIRRILKNR